MEQLSRFIFDAYAWDPNSATVTLRYRLDDAVEFTETLQFPKRGLKSQDMIEELLDRALFMLHLIGGMSYYKTCCPKEIVIRSGSLSPAEAAFWNEVYTAGLGQFFFENSLDFRGLINFPVSKAEGTPQILPFTTATEHVLVPLGGGKDSVVTTELLRAAKVPCVLLRMNSHPLITACAEKLAYPLMAVERTLSPRLFELNAQGAQNGHVPITAYVSTLSLLTALLYGYKAVVMSNERSANIGSTMYMGREVNHQWSKSLECERLFQQYIKTFITPDVAVFSLLRPLSELHIAKLFCDFPQYLGVTTSCNANWKIATAPESGKQPPEVRSPKSEVRTWCSSCPKCAFVFATMSAFLPKAELLRTFGKNLFEKETLLPLYRKLMGIEGIKPFECVGAPAEVHAALLLARSRGEYNDTLVMQLFLREVLPTISDIRATVESLFTPSPEHCIPPGYSTIVPPNISVEF